MKIWNAQENFLRLKPIFVVEFSLHLYLLSMQLLSWNLWNVCTESLRCTFLLRCNPISLSLFFQPFFPFHRVSPSDWETLFLVLLMFDSHFLERVFAKVESSSSSSSHNCFFTDSFDLMEIHPLRHIFWKDNKIERINWNAGAFSRSSWQAEIRSQNNTEHVWNWQQHAK